MRAASAHVLTTALLSLTLAGCGEEARESASVQYQDAVKSATLPPPPAAAPAPVASDAALREVVGTPGMAGSASDGPGAEGVSRKVIYDATLDLSVADAAPAAAKVAELVASSGGYIAEESLIGSPGSARSQFWRLRIPIDRFDGVVRSLMALGELERFDRKSQDVTAEYYDVEARIKNKQVQEKTLQKILEERSGQLEEVLKVEVELSRVRGEIEQMQGRLRVLQNLTSLATLSLTIRERDRFEPAAPVVASFPTRVARAWNDSVADFIDAGQALILFAVGQALWLPFWALGLFLAWRGAHWLVRATRTPASSPAPPPQRG